MVSLRARIAAGTASIENPGQAISEMPVRNDGSSQSSFVANYSGRVRPVRLKWA